jgi:hypothetical protein
VYAGLLQVWRPVERSRTQGVQQSRPNGLDVLSHLSRGATQVKETRARHAAERHAEQDPLPWPPQRHGTAARCVVELEPECDHDRRVRGPFPSCAARVFKPVDHPSHVERLPPAHQLAPETLGEQRLRFGWGAQAETVSLPAPPQSPATARG